MRSAIFYIDGLNLYHGIMHADLGDTRWLDVQALCQRMLRPGEQVMAVRYFNAPAWVDAKYRRQMVYINALEAHCDLVTIHMGSFKEGRKECPLCGETFRKHEEKQTDVAMGAHLVNDLYRKNHDISYFISGDTDHIGSIDVARQVRDIEIRVAFPPKRRTYELIEAADEHRYIRAKHLRVCQLPNPVTDESGDHLVKPAIWIA